MFRLQVVSGAITEALSTLNDRRERDFIGAMMWHHSMRSTEFFSRWVELKERTAELRAQNKGDQYYLQRQ